jgi:hypothetical protein
MRLTAHLNEHQMSAISSVRTSPAMPTFNFNRTMLATAGEDRRVRFRDFVSGTALRALSGREGYV